MLVDGGQQWVVRRIKSDGGAPKSDRVLSIVFINRKGKFLESKQEFVGFIIPFLT